VKTTEDKTTLKGGDFEIPKQPYIISFSNGNTQIIDYKTFNQILEQFETHQDIMLFTFDNSMINLNQIVGILPLKNITNPKNTVVENLKKFKEKIKKQEGDKKKRY
jgi:hypothetical protein